MERYRRLIWEEMERRGVGEVHEMQGKRSEREGVGRVGESGWW